MRLESVIYLLVVVLFFYACNDQEEEILTSGGKGIQVTMFDGTKKHITEVKIGDRVLGIEGSSHQIKNIVSGWMSEIIHIKTVKGKMIDLSPKSPMSTVSGWLKAEDLKVAMQVIGIDGPESILSIELIPYKDKVYNILFDEETAFIGNDLFIGDITMQNRLSNENP